MNHGVQPVIRRLSSTDALDVVSVRTNGAEEFFITAHPAGGNPDAMFANAAEFVRRHKATIVSQFVFGGCDLHADGLRTIGAACGPIRWPVTWIQGDGASSTLLTGTQVHAVAGAALTPVVLDGSVVGAAMEDADAQYVFLGDLTPPDPTRSRPQQVAEVYERIERALGSADMTFAHVVRTWMYLDRLLEWYDEFNVARTRFFEQRGVFDGLVPASTGIGVSNPQGAALVTDVLAIRPKHAGVTVRGVPSPLQCPATQYRSSFSRAVEIGSPGCRRLLVSGTASIAPDGKTVHVGNVERQIALTMDVVNAILESRRMGWSDVTRAIAYFKDIGDVACFNAYCASNGLSALPVAMAHADICRRDLLFEIEADAVGLRPAP